MPSVNFGFLHNDSMASEGSAILLWLGFSWQAGGRARGFAAGVSATELKAEVPAIFFAVGAGLEAEVLAIRLAAGTGAFDDELPVLVRFVSGVAAFAFFFGWCFVRPPQADRSRKI